MWVVNRLELDMVALQKSHRFGTDNKITIDFVLMHKYDCYNLIFTQIYWFSLVEFKGNLRFSRECIALNKQHHTCVKGYKNWRVFDLHLPRFSGFAGIILYYSNKQLVLLCWVFIHMVIMTTFAEIHTITMCTYSHICCSTPFWA